MKSILLLITLFFIIGCKDNLTTTDNKIQYSSIDTLVINNATYFLCNLENRLNCLINANGDTMIKSKDYYHSIEFIDIDKDSFIDLKVNLIGRDPNGCEIYLFDRYTKKHLELKNCYTDITPIKNSKCYYTYEPISLSDENWESYLVKIENFEIKNIGQIIGKGSENESQTIEIIKNDSIIEQLSYQKHIKINDDKWPFIEKYWSKNFNKFISR